MPPSTIASPRWMSWNGLVYYGETVGFVAAWAVGIAVILYAGGPAEPPRAEVEQVAAAGEPPR